MRIAFAYNVKHNNPSLDISKQVDLDFDLPKTIDKIIEVIESLGHDVVRVEADENAFNTLKGLKGGIDLVFNIAEGLYGDARESQIPLFCEILKIPYTHSSPTTHAIKLNKHLAKFLVRGLGFKVPQSVVVSAQEDIKKNRLNFPLIVKPNKEGSSKGIVDKSVVRDEKDLLETVRLVSEDFTSEVLLEEYIEGREFTVALLGNPPRVLPVIEQRFDFLPKGFNKIASFELKWVYEDKLKNLRDGYYCPAPLDEKMKNEIEDTSIAIYNGLNCLDAARIDYRLDEKGDLYFLEINTLPGINPDTSGISYFPLAARTAGLEYKDIVAAIISNASERFKINKTT